jgi:hypothetical protein
VSLNKYEQFYANENNYAVYRYAEFVSISDFLPVYRIGLSILIEIPVAAFSVFDNILYVYPSYCSCNLCLKNAAQFVEEKEQKLMFRKKGKVRGSKQQIKERKTRFVWFIRTRGGGGGRRRVDTSIYLVCSERRSVWYVPRYKPTREVAQNVLQMEYKFALLFTTHSLEATRGIMAGVCGGLHESVYPDWGSVKERQHRPFCLQAWSVTVVEIIFIDPACASQ